MVPNETKPFSDLENQKTEYSNEGFSRKPRTKEADFEAEKKIPFQLCFYVLW